jgi:pyruvate dehydrogenase E1 component alpha subunit
VEYLSILDEHGKVDKKLEPKMSDKDLLALFRLMLLTRRLDERCINLQRQGRTGTYGPIRGQEASHCASAFVLKKTDWCIQAYREPGAALHRGWPIKSLIQFWGGYEEGGAVPPNVNDLPISVPIASQVPHAMGLAWGAKMKGKDDVAMCFMGDGATSQGDFHEALNFAAVYNVPAIFISQNNQWAISLPREKQTKSATIAQKAIAYGFDGFQVDGNDALAVYVACTEAIEKARKGGGPTLIETLTYRMSVHTTADDPKRYRSDDEVKEWEKRDPIDRFRNYLFAKGVLDDKKLADLEESIKIEIKKGVEEYEAERAVSPLDCFKYIYREPTQEQAVQEKEYRSYLEREGLPM